MLEGEASLALAGGPVPLGPVTLPNQFLMGYRSAKHTINFHPQDPSIFSPEVDGCKGTFSVTAQSPLHKVVVSASTDPSTFFVVGGPTNSG